MTNDLCKYREDLIEQVLSGRRLVIARYGSGKSSVFLHTCKQLWARSPKRPIFIIICRKHLNHTWLQQSLLHWPELEVQNALYGNKTFELPEDPKQPVLLIVTATSLKKHIPLLRFIGGYVGAIGLDESTIIKNPKAQLTINALKLSAVFPDAIKLALTGDPQPEGSQNLWSQMQFCYGIDNPLGTSLYQHLQRYFLKHDFGWSLQHDMQEEFYRIIDEHSARLDDEGYEEVMAKVGVDDRRWITAYYEPSDEQQQLMQKLTEEWEIVTNEGKSIELWHSMAVAQKAQQIASGFYYMPEDTILSQEDDSQQHSTVTLQTNPKLDALIMLMQQLKKRGGRKVVICHAYNFEREMIQERLWQHKMNSCVVTKDDGEFRHPKYTAALVPLKKSQGLNDLSCASVMIFFSNIYSQEMRNQAEARTDRIGQHGSVLEYYDLCSTALYDRQIVEALQTKQLTPRRLDQIITTHLTKEQTQHA